jgi:hypothetical protein
MKHTKKHHRTLVSTFISFLAEWDYRSRLIDLSDAGSKEPFFSHLFRGCLLFESLLKANDCKPPTRRTLGKMLKHDFASEFHISPHFNATETNLTILCERLRQSSRSLLLRSAQPEPVTRSGTVLFGRHSRSIKRHMIF